MSTLPMLYHQIVLLLFIGLMSWAALSDALHYIIPNSTTLSLLVLYPAHVMASPVPVDWIGAIILSAILFALGVGIFARGIAGGGDVKLLSATALWVGPAHLPAFLIVMGFSGGALALVVLVSRHARRLRLRLASGNAFATENAAGNGCGIMAGLEQASDPAVITAPSTELVPYGVAIAVGGAYVGLQFITGT
jgi:prepilin peptidase CpaA